MNANRVCAAVVLLGWTGGFALAIGAARGSEPADNNQIPAPEFADVTEWLQSEPLKLAEQKGKVVVVHFWTNGCINCIHNYPHYRAWQKKYQNEKRFLMVGIHTPETEPEKNVAGVQRQLARNKLTFAVAVDNDAANWRAWNNRYWPTVYVVDKSGAVRFRWEGELGHEGFKQLTALIDELLAQKEQQRDRVNVEE